MTTKAPAWAAFAICFYGQLKAESADVRGLIEQGNAALAQNRLREAAAAFKKLSIWIRPPPKRMNNWVRPYPERFCRGNVRPSADSDVAERAENHLRRAIELAPFASAPLMELSELEAASGRAVGRRRSTSRSL